MKYFKFILIIILRLIILIAAGGYFLSKFYGDEIKNRIIGELNKQLTIKIDVEKVDFSPYTFLQNFPNVSVDLYNVTAFSNSKCDKKYFTINTDTLLVTGKLSLQFSITDIWKENYELTHIIAEKGRLNLFIDAKGNGNYEFWKSDTSQTGGNIEIKIKDLKIKDMALTYIDLYNDINIKSFTEFISLQGNFGSEKYLLVVETGMFTRHLTVGKVKYIKNHNVEIQVDMSVDKDLYAFKEGSLKIAGLRFDLTGTIKADKEPALDLVIKGDELDIPAFVSVMPPQYLKYTENYRNTGDLFFETTIQGKVSNKRYPHINTVFGIKNGTIFKKDSDVELTNVVIDGNFSNGASNCISSSELHFTKFSADMRDSKLSGEFSITNFEKPYIKLMGDVNFDLSELSCLFRLDTIEILTGRLTGNINFNGKINNLEKLTSEDFRNAQTQGDVKLQEVSFKLIGNEYLYHNLSGTISFRNNDLQLDNIHFDISDQEFNINGLLKNFLNYLFLDNQTVSIEGYFNCPSLDLPKLLSKDERGNTSSEIPEIVLPDNINLNVAMSIDKFQWQKFVASNVKGSLLYHNKQLVINDMNLKTMGGLVRANIEIEQQPDKNIFIRTTTETENIDITKLFYSFDNFGQEFIIDKHLKGRVTSSIYFSSLWSNTLVPYENEIYAESELEISNGELINFEPMMELSKFIEVEELKHVRFSTLKNTILIKDRLISIPQMDINSSAINISASGIHSFENEYSYKVKALVSELLARKAKRDNKDNNSFGTVEDDGLGRTNIYLLITGKGEDCKISYDKKKIKEVIKDDYQNEKNELKTILKEEFGWFKNDSSLIKKKQEKEKEQEEKKKQPYKLVWDE
ncbi:MAG: hypothetical protein HY738_14995 [Bacteroidia bacterium]|nr:hypothetical protein [Bacteroidia bacterium]